MPHLNKKRNANQMPEDLARTMPGFRAKANGYFTYLVSGKNKHFRVWGHINSDVFSKMITKAKAEELKHSVPLGTFLVQKKVGAAKRWFLCGSESVISSALG